MFPIFAAQRQIKTMAKIDLHNNSSFRVCLVDVAVNSDTPYNALSKKLERACCVMDT